MSADTLWGMTAQVCSWRRDFRFDGMDLRYWEYVCDELHIGMCFKLLREPYVNSYGGGIVAIRIRDQRFKLKVERVAQSSSDDALVGHWLTNPMSDADLVELRLRLSDVITS